MDIKNLNPPASPARPLPIRIGKYIGRPEKPSLDKPFNIVWDPCYPPHLSKAQFAKYEKWRNEIVIPWVKHELGISGSVMMVDL